MYYNKVGCFEVSYIGRYKKEYPYVFTFLKSGNPWMLVFEFSFQS